MAGRYAFVVGADRSLLPMLNALLNSLEHIGFRGDVQFIAFQDTPQDYLEEVQGTMSYRLEVIPFEEKLYRNVFGGNKSDYMKRFRYRVASDLSYQYDAVCFLDADMFFVQPVDLFFRIAERADVILGCAKTTKVRYGGNPSYHFDGHDILEEPVLNVKDMCCCPIFFTETYAPVFEGVFHAYTTQTGRMKASDLFAINGMILRHGADEFLLTLPCQSWVGTNETMLKPYTRVVEKDGHLVSENGDLVYSVHGKWHSPGWHAGQRLHMDRLIEKECGMRKLWTSRYQGSLGLIFKWFKRMALEGPVSLRDWTQYVKPDIQEFLLGGEGR